MDSRIPLPTDNIFKFLALFGLVIMVSGLTLLIYSNQSTNELIWLNAAAMYDLDSGSDHYKQEKIDLLSSQISVAVKDRALFKWALSAFIGIGLLLSLDGFRRWYKEVQPIHDELLALQKKKLELEIGGIEVGKGNTQS